MNRNCTNRTTAAIAMFVSFAIIGLGLGPSANAGVVTTGDSILLDANQERMLVVRDFLSRDDVTEKLVAFGVAPETVTARLEGLTDAELIQLHDSIEHGVAGGDVLGLIGAVFLVLLILELLGVTNVFSAI